MKMKRSALILGMDRDLEVRQAEMIQDTIRGMMPEIDDVLVIAGARSIFFEYEEEVEDDELDSDGTVEP